MSASPCYIGNQNQDAGFHISGHINRAIENERRRSQIVLSSEEMAALDKLDKT
jgi:hypothetical protein